MEQSLLSRYDRERIQGFEDEIQYHETMKRQHDEAIAKLRSRIGEIRHYAMPHNVAVA
jgi:hypothetical protein